MRNLSKTVLGTVAALALTASAAFATVPAQTNCAYSFSTNMKLGNVSSDVMNLQKLLNKDVRTQVAASGTGSAGKETSRFGPATFAAVKKFQAANGVSPVSGFAGSLTRAMLNTVCNGTAATGTPVVSGPISVSTAASQPNATLVAGQSGAKIGEFTFTGNGSVSVVEFMRTGVSSNNALVNVYLYEGNTRLTDSSSVLTDGSIRFATPWTVNGTRNITVRADILAGVSGQTVGVAAKSLTLTGASSSTMVVGVQSGLQAIANATLATAALSGTNVAVASINAGQTSTNVWSQTLNVGTRAVKLHGMTFKMIGSALADSLANVSLFIDGAKVGNSTTVDSMGRVMFDMSSSPMLLNTGNRTVEVRADIIKGSFRNFQFSLENVADIRLEDRDISGVFISTTGTIPNTAGLISINAGNLTTALDPAYTATQVVGGATNVEIGRFQIKSFGEDVKVTSLTVTPVLTGTTPAASGLNNVSLYINGGQVGTAQNWTTGNLTFNNLGSSVFVTAGTPVVVTVKADLVTTGNVNYTAGTASVNLVLGSNNAQGVNSNQLTNTGAVTGKTLTISTGAAGFGTKSGFNAQTINQNTANVKVGSFTLQASNADALRVTNLNVGITVTGMPLTSVTNLIVKDGSTVLGTPQGNVAATNNNFSVNINVPTSGTKEFDVYADIGNAANTDSVTASMLVTYNGVTNTSSITTTPVQGAGVAMTVNTANLAVGSPVVNSSPVAQYVTPGNKEIATFNIKSTNGASSIQKMTFNLSGVTGVNSITVGGVTKSIITGATSIVVDGLAIAVPFTNSGVAIPVSVNYNAVGLNQTATNLTNLITVSNIEFISGNTTNNFVPAGAVSNSFTLVQSMPTAVKGTGLSLGTGSGTGVKVGTISVTANSTGEVNLKALPINIGMPTGGTISAVVLKKGNTAITGSCTAAANTVCTFTSVDRVAAGATNTYDVFVDYTGITTSGNVSVNAGPAGSFLWDDTNTATPGILTGTLLQNYGN